MSKIDLLDQQWIDLVFEGKNEAYGAYQIRKGTGQRNFWALLILVGGIAAIVTFFVLYGVAKNVFTPEVDVEQAVEVEADIQDDQEEEQEEEEIIVEYEEPQEQEQQVLEEELVQSEKFTELSLDDEKPVEVAKTADEANQSDKASGAMDSDVGEAEAGKLREEADVIVEEKTVEDNEVHEITSVEKMPHFPNETDTQTNPVLLKWLGSNIKYPSVAEENGDQGRVVCTFVVEKDGSISDVKVVRGVTPALDKEAIRVIKSMPRWSPGQQNGHAVRVKFTLPITFKLN